MAGEEPTTTQEQPQRQPPTQQGFVARIEQNMRLLGFANFLLHPDKIDFEHYSGTYPSGMRDRLSAIVEMAKRLGYEIDLEANISEALDDMSAEDFFKILYDPSADNPDTPDTNEAIQLTLESFKRLMAHPGVKDAFLNITKSIVGNDPELNVLLAAKNIDADLSALQHDGKSLTDMKLSELTEDVASEAVSGMSRDDIKALLNSLPEDGEDGDLTQKTVIGIMNDKLEENGYDRVLTDDMPIDVAIGRATREIDHTGLKSLLISREKAEDIVFEGIQSGLTETINETVAASRASIADGSYLTELTDDDLYTMFETQLKSEEGRENILNAMAQPDNLQLIKTNLASADILTLMQGLPNGQALIDEKMSVHMWNSVRDFLDQNGLFQMASSAWGGLIQFIGGILEKFGLDSVAEQLQEQLDITRFVKAESPLIQQYQQAAGPNLNQPQGIRAPLIEPDPRTFSDPQTYLEEGFSNLFALSDQDFNDIKTSLAEGITITGGDIPENFMSMSRGDYIVYMSEKWKDNPELDTSAIPADILKTSQDLLQEHNIDDPSGDIANRLAFGAVETQKSINDGPAIITAPGQGR